MKKRSIANVLVGAPVLVLEYGAFCHFRDLHRRIIVWTLNYTRTRHSARVYFIYRLPLSAFYFS